MSALGWLTTATYTVLSAGESPRASNKLSTNPGRRGSSARRRGSPPLSLADLRQLATIRLLARLRHRSFGKPTSLTETDLVLPETGWGSALLHRTRPSVGKQWTDSGETHGDRGLKNRPSEDVRPVPQRHPAARSFDHTNRPRRQWPGTVVRRRDDPAASTAAYPAERPRRAQPQRGSRRLPLSPSLGGGPLTLSHP